MVSTGAYQPFAEPWRTTALRTGGIALAIGVVVGLYQRQLAAVPDATLLALWFTLWRDWQAEVLERSTMAP